MGKTIRKFEHEIFRSPKGRKQAIIQGARKKPPSDWDDIPTSGICVYSKMAHRLAKRGFSHQEITQKIITKAKRNNHTISYKIAAEIADEAINYPHR